MIKMLLHILIIYLSSNVYRIIHDTGVEALDQNRYKEV